MTSASFHAPTRREFGGLLLGAAAALAEKSPAYAGSVCRDAAPAPLYRGKPDRPLGEINPGVYWGAHLEGAGIYDETFVKALSHEKPSVLAIGSGLKFGNLHPLSLEFEREANGKKFSTWAEVDDIVRLAQKLGASTRGDALYWNDWPPNWAKDLVTKRPKGWRLRLGEAFERNIAAVFEHFEDLDRQYGRRVMPWCGLINEPFAYWSVSFGKPGWREGVWLDAFGAEPDGIPGYIHKAFELAEKYSPASKPALYLNESNCDNDKYGSLIRPAMLALVDHLQNAGRKINAVGLEAHLQPQWMDDPLHPDWRSLVAFLKELQKRGLEIYITELDVNDCLLTGMAERDRLVADYTYSFASAVLEVPAVRMITNWDFADGGSWYRDDSSPDAMFPKLGTWPKCQAKPACPRPTIYDQNLTPKSARDALARAFAEREK